jgi:hypothetical protein
VQWPLLVVLEEVIEQRFFGDRVFGTISAFVFGAHDCWSVVFVHVCRVPVARMKYTPAQWTRLFGVAVHC